MKECKPTAIITIKDGKVSASLDSGMIVVVNNHDDKKNCKGESFTRKVYEK